MKIMQRKALFRSSTSKKTNGQNQSSPQEMYKNVEDLSSTFQQNRPKTADECKDTLNDFKYKEHEILQQKEEN